jgi:glycine hydroxymethyltransferase
MIMCKEQFAKQIDRAVFPGMQGGPHDHTIAAKAVAFGEALKPEFKIYAKQVIENAKLLAEELIKRGYRVISGGTDNHLIVVDMTSKNITGRDAEVALDKIGISINRSTIPNDPNPPMKPSGIRLGTPALTTRGMKEAEILLIAELIDEAIINKESEEKLGERRLRVKQLCGKFPLPTA